MKFLITYATTEGQTEKVARFAASKLKELGHAVFLQDANNYLGGLDPENFDRVILAGSVHENGHQKELGLFVATHRHALESRKTLLLSVSLSAAFDTTLTDAEGYVKKFCDGLEWHPDSYSLVAGAIRHESYGYYKEMILRHSVLRDRAVDDPEQDHEFTDWDALAKAVVEFAKE